MPKSTDAIREANRIGNLGLIIYSIPNFPDPETYQSVIASLASNSHVSVLETTFPVADRYSEYANETIRHAHHVALKHGSGLESIDHLRSLSKPKICVLYQATYEDEGFSRILQHSSGNLDGLLFEWEVEKEADFDHQCQQHQIELVHCAGSYMTTAEVDKLASNLPPDPLIYFESAAMTGAKLDDLEEMKRFAKLLKSKRPDFCLAAGFGVKTAEDVKALSEIDELDGVIVGTAFLQAIGDGREKALEYIDDITQALSRS